jgi:hypothetical protein
MFLFPQFAALDGSLIFLIFATCMSIADISTKLALKLYVKSDEILKERDYGEMMGS